MPNILKASAKVHAARNFIKSFYDVGGTDYMYIGLGDHGGEWATPTSPDAPLDSIDEETVFWQNLVGVGKLSGVTDTEVVVPRKTWVSGTTYVPFNPSTETGSGSFDNATGRDFYICNTETSPKVYKCLLAGGGACTQEPSHTIPEGAVPAPPVNGTDGYQWAYLYTIGAGADVPAALLTASWMPVPTEAPVYSQGIVPIQGQLITGDDSSGTYGEYYSNQIYQCLATSGATSNILMAEDMNNTWAEWTAPQQLGGFYAGCSLVFPDYAGTGDPPQINNVAYRQVALLRNPKTAAGIRMTAQWNGSDFEPFASLTRGVVMTLDNRVTITRAVGQTETVRLILEF